MRIAIASGTVEAARETISAVPFRSNKHRPMLDLDLDRCGISTTITNGGCAYDYDWIELRIFAEGSIAQKHPIHKRGVTNAASTCVLSLPWLFKLRSSVLRGDREDAACNSNRIVSNDLADSYLDQVQAIAHGIRWRQLRQHVYALPFVLRREKGAVEAG